jgi:tetratricopeptide (TPR) repeat protein
MSCPKFIGNRGISSFNPTDDIICMKTFPPPGEAFSKRPDMGLEEGATVTYVAMQLAYYMGFSEVVLIGMDHHFVTQGTPHKTVVSDGDDSNHFDSSYFGKGLKWQLPDLEGSEKSYRVAKQVFEESGRRIIDATVNGRCQVFSKQNYQQVFHKNYLESQKIKADIKPFETQVGGIENNPDKLSAYYQALEINPKSGISYLKLANALVKQDKLDAAIVFYKLVCKVEPSSSNAAEAYINLKDCLEKVQSISKMTSENNFHKTTNNQKNLSQNYGSFLKRDFIKATEDNPDDLSGYYQALEKNPQSGTLYLKLANALVRENKLDAAIVFYKLVCKVEPDSPNAANAYISLKGYLPKVKSF